MPRRTLLGDQVQGVDHLAIGRETADHSPNLLADARIELAILSALGLLQLLFWAWTA